MFDWQSIEERAAARDTAALVLSGQTRVLIADALAAMNDRYRWYGYPDWFTVEDAVNKAHDELLGGYEPPAEDMILLDDFNRADGPLGANWTADPFNYNHPSLVVASNQARTVEGVDSSAYFSAEAFDLPVRVEVTIPVDNVSAAAGIILCLDQPGGNDASAYFVIMNNWNGPRVVTVFRIDNPGLWVELETAEIDFGNGDTLAVVVDGAQITVDHFDQTEWLTILEHTDGAPLNQSGYVGLFAGSTLFRFDDLKVGQP